MQFRNDELVATLPAAEGKGYSPAYLLDKDRNILYKFLYNPEELNYNRSLDHASVKTALASMSTVQFTGADGGRMTFSDLKLEARDKISTTLGQPPTVRSIVSLVKGIEALAVADVPNGKYTPSEVYFSWGTFTFGPAYIVDSIDCKFTRFPGGEPTEAILSFTLQEIPPVLLDTVNQRQFEADYNGKLQQEQKQNEDEEAKAAKDTAIENASNSTEGQTEDSDAEIFLSLRQQDEGEEEAATWLRQNITSLPSDIRRLYRSNNFVLYVKEDGTVVLEDGTFQNGTVGNNAAVKAILGTYDGSNFTPEFSEANSNTFRTTR